MRPFLATDLQQFDTAWASQGNGSEAIVFDRQDVLDDHSWALIKSNLCLIRKAYPEAVLIFHFPINGSNYLADAQVRNRLWEALDYLAVVRASGIVLHANQTDFTHTWSERRVREDKNAFLNFVTSLSARVEGMPQWVGLENMPVTGNDNTEFDPVLVYPQDLRAVCGANVGATIDFCHLSYTAHISALVQTGRFPDHLLYPHIEPFDDNEIWKLADIVVHSHFSAFRGFANGNARCSEGVLPWASSLGRDWYEVLLRRIAREWPELATMTFEVTEKDYAERSAFPQMVKWANSCLADADGRK